MWRDGSDALVRIHVQPGASSPGVVGRHGDALRLRVLAPPVEDRANAECMRLLASLLGVRIGDLDLVSGRRSRQKIIRIRGMTPEAAAERLGV